MPKLLMTDVIVSRRSTAPIMTTLAFGLGSAKNQKTWFVVRGRERLRTMIGQYPAISRADAREGAARRIRARVGT